MSPILFSNPDGQHFHQTAFIMYAIIRQRSWLVCHYGIAEDGRPGHPAGGIQLLLRYIRRADPGIRFCIPDRIIY